MSEPRIWFANESEGKSLSQTRTFDKDKPTNPNISEHNRTKLLVPDLAAYVSGSIPSSEVKSKPTNVSAMVSKVTAAVSHVPTPIKKPIITFRGQESFLDIEGDRYYLDTEKSVELDFKSRDDFIKNYNATDLELFKRVFSTALTTSLEERIRDLQIEERDELLKGISFRINKLKTLISINKTSLVAFNNKRLMDRLILLKKSIEDMLSLPETPTAIQEGRIKAPKVFALMDNKPQQLETILRIAWILVNPDKVDPIQLQGLEQIISAQKPMDIMKAIDRNSRATNADGKKLKVTNYFDRVRLKKVVSAPSEKNALKIAESEIVSLPAEDVIRKRLEQVLTIFQTHKYMDSEVYKQLLDNIYSDQIYDGRIGQINKELMDKISVSFDPVYKFYRSVYFPVYDDIVIAMKNHLAEYDFNLMMRSLGRAMIYVRSKKEENGIYKLVSKDMNKLQTLITQISSSSSYIENEQYVDLLPDFILKQFHYKIIKKGKVKQEVAKPHLKNIEFYTLDQLAIPSKPIDIREDISLTPEQKSALIETMKTFFSPDAVYMIVKHKRDKSQDMFRLTTIDFNTPRFVVQAVETPLNNKNVPIYKVISKMGRSINYTVLALATLILFKSRISGDPERTKIDFDTGEIEDDEL